MEVVIVVAALFVLFRIEGLQRAIKQEMVEMCGRMDEQYSDLTRRLDDLRRERE